MKISICSVTYNRKFTVMKWIERLLNSLDLRFENEILIHDNCSKDGTFEMLMEYGVDRIDCKYDIKIFRSTKNLGKPYALNRLFEIANGDYWVSTDSDIGVTRGWAEPLINHLNKYNDLGLVSPTYVDNSNNPVARIDRDKVKEIFKNRDLAYFRKDLKYNIAGGFIMLKPKLFKEIGMYDENGLYGGNDANINVKFDKKNYKCAYAKDVCVEHLPVREGEEGYEEWKVKTNKKRREDPDFIPNVGYWD